MKRKSVSCFPQHVLLILHTESRARRVTLLTTRSDSISCLIVSCALWPGGVVLYTVRGVGRCFYFRPLVAFVYGCCFPSYYCILASVIQALLIGVFTWPAAPINGVYCSTPPPPLSHTAPDPTVVRAGCLHHYDDKLDRQFRKCFVASHIR